MVPSQAYLCAVELWIILWLQLPAFSPKRPVEVMDRALQVSSMNIYPALIPPRYLTNRLLCWSYTQKLRYTRYGNVVFKGIFIVYAALLYQSLVSPTAFIVCTVGQGPR